MFVHRYLRYLFSIVLILGTLASAYMLIVFSIMPMFELRTLFLIASSFILTFTSAIMSIPRFEKWFREKTQLKSSVYWSIILGCIALSILLIVYAVGVGGVDYTNYMQQKYNAT